MTTCTSRSTHMYSPTTGKAYVYVHVSVQIGNVDLTYMYLHVQSGPGSKHVEAKAEPSTCLFSLKTEP